ncbi:hypothetical protein PoB_005849700 [Plakobranchus ocellatus]|uniref:Uncharacterized protein n=1 Tax=Plakobranchus ocellatus TaxID=259542 RepID=A0AAV4CJW0_9GAST|nr:hypothetical protein PoB_005849700 [Plakobranchus ocellatus]
MFSPSDLLLTEANVHQIVALMECQLHPSCQEGSIMPCACGRQQPGYFIVQSIPLPADSNSDLPCATSYSGMSSPEVGLLPTRTRDSSHFLNEVTVSKLRSATHCLLVSVISFILVIIAFHSLEDLSNTSPAAAQELARDTEFGHLDRDNMTTWRKPMVNSSGHQDMDNALHLAGLARTWLSLDTQNKSKTTVVFDKSGLN